MAIPQMHDTETQSVAKPVDASYHGPALHDHAVQFYKSHGFLANVVAEYVAEGLAAGVPAIIIATAGHRRAVSGRLSRMGVDVRDARRREQLTMLDARETLSTFMRGSFPDKYLFRKHVGGAVHNLVRAGGAPPVRAYGEMVDLLWRDGNADAAIRLEEMWNELAQTHRFSLLCAYCIDGFSSSADAERFKTICGTHTRVIPTEEYLDHNEDARLVEVTLLQQRAAALETEIRQRLVLEQNLRETVAELEAGQHERDALLERERLARADAERAWADANRVRLMAEESNRVKSEFLAVMSHELRTPLNAIGGYAELMELGVHGPVSPSQRESLERIQRSQRHLLGLINQVLNYARIESGSLRYDICEIALDEILRTAEALIVPQVRAKELNYSYNGCPADVVVRADGDKLQQIVLNLLANAIKFTDRGGAITLKAIVTREKVLVRVSDSGIGIAEDKLPSIFDPFVQIDSNYTRTRDGVGLGLAISRDLARGMSADLTVRSKEGLGSTFTLELSRVP